MRIDRSLARRRQVQQTRVIGKRIQHALGYEELE
jgi:hypothetical protein